MEVLGLVEKNPIFTSTWTLITGGASGIGLACADYIASLGGQLVLFDIDVVRLGEAAAKLRNHGGKVKIYQIDITQTAELEAIAASLDAEGLDITHLITAAGVLQPMLKIENLHADEHDRVWAINYHGTYHCCRIWGRRMRIAKRGSIVTVSSITSMRATPLLAYGPAKAALEALTASLAVSYAASGVRINAVAPGFTLTEALRDKINAGQRDASSILAGVPMARFITPYEVAKAVGFLLSDASSAITGVTLPVDAGWLCGASWSTFQPMPMSAESHRAL
jgi:NAD(P)-dependent dehydrogenase (short-subunit alcohol dehydrogenase family)